MTFNYIIKTILSKWVTILSNTNMMKNLVIQETQSLNITKSTVNSLLTESLSNNECCYIGN